MEMDEDFSFISPPMWWTPLLIKI